MADLTISRFRARFPEFSAAPDEMVQIAMDDARPLVNKRRFGATFEQGWANLAAAFLLSMTQASGDDGSGEGGTASTLPVTQQTAGKVSFQTAAPANTSGDEFDAWLSTSTYGLRYLALRKLAGMGAMVVPGFRGGCCGGF
ncbi:DUF4054 domain-containing protein [Erwinia sp. HR93]|uniref:DUF4054 domain-containing protein n=1 Tax=Erwinia sp. HR93 TaxID=3094840 RepID=UPI002ADEEA30|nr:DUF4054 domain-containing protein [Erwinia sp. HR93]MEA1064741.1 DUF4054 domain-containing protein [Erwinia sp. HR93]